MTGSGVVEQSRGGWAAMTKTYGHDQSPEHMPLA